MSTLTSVTQIPEGEFVEHPDEILHRVAAGEDLTVTIGGKAAVDMTPYWPPVSLQEFLSWPKADRGLLEDIREMRGGDTTEDRRNPWERWA